LQGINLILTPRKRLAVVGPSGAGKSTLANLLMRFWDFSQGSITLDERDIHEYAQEDVRQLFNFVSQRPFFFNDSIRNNLLLAQPQACESTIQGAIECAQIKEFISGLPMKFETEIGELGFRLSGGERQRLAIARALIKDAPVFLLDEPTANLDTITERNLLNSLFSRLSNRSIILITHRLIRLEDMDEILVLDHGRFIENGTHEELLAKAGLYKRLWDSQNRIIFDRIAEINGLQP
jgi:ABC-type multidrug transport system fused ATPase/permease subunit